MQNPLSKVKDVLEQKANSATTHTVSPEDTVFDAVGVMNQHRVGAAVVLEEERVVGIFTERDVLTRVVGADLDSHTTPVARVMTPDPICVSGSSSVTDLMTVATEKRCRHFPVVENERLVGLVSIGDLVHWEIRDQETQLDSAIRAIRAISGR